MKRNVTAVVALIAVVGTSAASAHGPEHKHGGLQGHGHSAFAAGEPGDSRIPSRIVEVSMRETDDGKMLFAPDSLNVRQGEQVKFVLRNVGQVEHEFVLDAPEANAAHGAAMAADPGMKHTDPNGRQVEPAKTGELLWRFTRPGTFEFACLIPGHYEAGMKGSVTVK